MARYNFDLKNKEIIDNIRSPAVYAYNMAQNLALLSNDASVIRRFYQVEIPKYFKDTWLTQEAENNSVPACNRVDTLRMPSNTSLSACCTG